MDPQNPPPQPSIPPVTPPSQPHRSISLPLIIGGLVIILLIAFGGFYLGTKSQGKPCTMEAKICPDGSSVGRTGPNCEFAPCPTTSTEKTNNFCNEASSAATQGLPNFLQASPDYQGKAGTLGKGYLIYTVDDLAKVANYTNSQTIASIISPTSTCYFSVSINNLPTTDLTVEKQNSAWVAVAIGGNLTKKVAEVEKQLTGNYNLKLVRTRPMNLDFALLETNGKEFIAPFTPTDWYGMEEGKLYPADEAMSHYKVSFKDK